MVSFSGRPLGGTVALNIIGNPSAVHMSLFQYLATIFCWCVFPCCHCLLPVLHHNILLSNCRPILGIEWLSRHQPSHQWSESINWVLWFLGFFLVCGGIEQTAMKLLFFFCCTYWLLFADFGLLFFILFLSHICWNWDEHWKSYFFRFSRHDWYQTESHVVVTVMAKNISKDGVCVSFTEKEV